MKKILYIALKELRSYFSDKGDLAFSLLLPIAIFALLYGAYGSEAGFNGTAYVVNHDEGGQYSEKLIEKIEEVEGLNLELLTEEDADRRISNSDIVLAIYIPENFSADLAARQPVEILFKQRGNGGTEGQIITGIVRSAVEEIGQEFQVYEGVSTALAGKNIDQATIDITVQKFIEREKEAPLIGVTGESIGTGFNLVNQFLPGIITMFVLFSINLASRSIVEERKKGTLERLLTTRLTVGQLFLGKFTAGTLRAFLQTLILLALSYAVFGLFTPLSFGQILLMALIFSATCSSMALFIASIARTEDQATWIGVFITIISVMVSGTFIVISEGTLLSTLSKFSVNTYANDAFRAIINGGISLADLKLEMIVLISVAVVLLAVSRILFKAVGR